MKRGHWLLLAALLTLGPMGFWLSQTLTVSEQRIELGPSPAARSNPYLAMQYFLNEQEHTVEWLASLSRLPPVTDNLTTLILLNQDAPLIDHQRSTLLSWVAQGGHLVISAQDEPLNNKHASLLQSVGIKKQLSRELDPPQTPSAQQPDNAASPNNLPPALTRLYLENELSPAYLALDSNYHLADTDNRAHAWANSQTATQLLQLSHGHGLITVLSDFKLWRNQHIGQYDHAWLLWYLSQDTQVLLFNPPAQRGLLALLWQHFALACVLLIILLLFAAWHAAPRFGPLRTTESINRRRLAEHLQASVLFNLRYNGQRSVLSALQKDIAWRAQQRQPNFSSLNVAQQWQVLQHLSRQPMSTISQCMRPAPTKKLSAQAFTLHVQRLQQIRNAL